MNPKPIEPAQLDLTGTPHALTTPTVTPEQLTLDIGSGTRALPNGTTTTVRIGRKLYRQHSMDMTRKEG